MAKDFFCIDRLETGNRIYNHRKQKHLTQEGLAGVLASMGMEVSVNSIGRWERGEVDISYQYACALCEVFGCELYGGLIVYYLRGIAGERLQPVFCRKVSQHVMQSSAAPAADAAGVGWDLSNGYSQKRCECPFFIRQYSNVCSMRGMPKHTRRLVEFCVID